MVALALIPAASFIAISLVSGDLKLAGKAAFRFAVDFITNIGIETGKFRFFQLIIIASIISYY